MLTPISRRDLEDASSQARAQLVIDRVRETGIKGLGGGKFPTAAKLSLAHSATGLIINGMQSEPDNKSDMALLQAETQATIAGIGLVTLVCAAKTITLALPTGLDKGLSADVQKALQAELDWLNEFGSKTCDARQVYLPGDYAIGEEHELARRLGLIHSLEDAGEYQAETEQQSTIPLIELGVLCINLATCYAIGQSVYQGELLTRRMVTVNGEAKWLDFGTPVAEVVSPAWINGRHGGNANHRQQVDAGTFCITAPPPNPIAPCINCSACRPVCPVNLEPDELYRASVKGPVLSHLNLDACIECGACNAACPSGLHLTQQFREAKRLMTKTGKLKADAAKANARVKTRKQRLKRDEEQREEQRKERVQARSEDGRRTW